MSGVCAKFLLSTAIVVTACSDVGTAPAVSRSIPASSSSSVSSFIVAPASLDWQQRARDLVAANNLTPLSAARVYAALSAAEYRALMMLSDADQDGTLPREGLGSGGRSALEAHRGAVAVVRRRRC